MKSSINNSQKSVNDLKSDVLLVSFCLSILFSYDTQSACKDTVFLQPIFESSSFVTFVLKCFKMR